MSVNGRDVLGTSMGVRTSCGWRCFCECMGLVGDTATETQWAWMTREKERKRRCVRASNERVVQPGGRTDCAETNGGGMAGQRQVTVARIVGAHVKVLWPFDLS